MPTPPRTPVALRLMAPVAVVGVLLLGLWFFAGRVTNGYELSIALSIAWFVVASMAFGRLTKSRPDLRPWVRSATILTSIAVCGWFYWTSIRETEVDEQVAVGAPARQVQRSGAREAAGRRAGDGEAEEGRSAPQRRNVQVAGGSVRSLAHSGRGTARVIDLARGGRVLTLTRFDIDPGPQVEVRLVEGDDLGGRHRLLGDLKGSKGDQQYRIPQGTDLSRFDTVVFWCVPFTQALARADLRPS